MSLLMVGAALAVGRITTVLTGQRLVVTLMAVWLIVVMTVLAYVAKRRRRESSLPGVVIGDSTPDACWKWGFIYYNPDDPAIVVETRAGRFGCDLNFGNKWSWILSAVILATPLLVGALWF